jgi:RNA polymerase sigma factor (sigma-70 family)
MQPPTNTPLSQAARGDEEALYRRHHRDLERVVAHAVRAPRELIEDACQTAWATLLRSQPERPTIFAWLRVVAKHEAFALLARRRREIPGEELPLVASVSDFADVVDARDALRLLAQLKPQQRQVLLLRAEGHSYKAICELTGRTYTWVNRHISEGRQALRLLIDDQ